MPRIARVVIPDYPHHVTQRGNYRQAVFLEDADYERYLELVRDCIPRYSLEILAYCLMPNHVHFIALPRSEDSLARVFNVAAMRYSQYSNRKHRVHGHLWQGRFYSCILDQAHLNAATRYVERNPVRAHLARKPWQWRWSSAPAHTGAPPALSLDVRTLFNYVDVTPGQWKGYIDNQDDPKALQDLRRLTSTGRPFGSPSFIQRIEKHVGKRLHALAWGRPKKQKVEK